EDAHVEGYRLELDLPSRDGERVSEGDGGESAQGEEDRDERRQLEHEPVRPRGHEVFLGQHLDGIGQWVEETQDADAEDARAIGAQPVLHDGGLLALHPGEDAAEVEHHEHDERHGNGLEEEIKAHSRHAFTMAPVSPIVRYVMAAKAGTPAASALKTCSARSAVHTGS